MMMHQAVAMSRGLGCHAIQHEKVEVIREKWRLTFCRARSAHPDDDVLLHDVVMKVARHFLFQVIENGRDGVLPSFPSLSSRLWQQ
jgi:hypothetical protein